MEEEIKNEPQVIAKPIIDEAFTDAVNLSDKKISLHYYESAVKKLKFAHHWHSAGKNF